MVGYSKTTSLSSVKHRRNSEECTACLCNYNKRALEHSSFKIDTKCYKSGPYDSLFTENVDICSSISWHVHERSNNVQLGNESFFWIVNLFDKNSPTESFTNQNNLTQFVAFKSSPGWKFSVTNELHFKCCSSHEGYFGVLFKASSL